MGWWWSSSGTAAPSNSQNDSPQAPQPPKDAALDEFLTAITDATSSTPAKPPPADDETLYTSHMSCVSCFDQAYYCSSLGGQMTNIYRYGGMRSCSDLWEQWRFCMRTKAMSESTRRERIREWEKKRAAKYRIGKSSEDVWRPRNKPVEGAFMGTITEEEIALRDGC